MKLTSLSIKTQEFTKTMRGYDTEEVHTFLEKIAGEVQTLVNENKKLKEDIEAFQKKTEDIKKIEDEAKETLAKAQESSSKIIESANQQSNIIVKEAELKASLILDSVNQKTSELKTAIETLRQEKNLIISKLRAIITSQANLLEGKLKDTFDETETGKKTEKSEDVKIDVDDIVNKLL
jgi:cell division initiation protein